jgi:ATP-dependent DNA helicase RecG
MTGEPRRREIPEIPYEALREAIINATAHRDYFKKGTNIMVEMFDDRIDITNFGGLAKGLNPEDFGKKSVLRNPNIANLLHRAGYIEKMGTGINKMKNLISKAGLPPIKFEFDNFFTVTFKRLKIKESIIIPETFSKKFDEMLHYEGVNEGVNEGVKFRLKKEISYLNTYKSIRRPNVERLFNISTATAERDLSILKRLNLIIFEGAPKTGGYVLTNKGKNILDSATS